MKKFTTLSLMVFVLVILAGCGQQQTNQTKSTTQRTTKSSDTTNISKVFTDNFVGYEIEYPSNWNVSQNKTSDISNSEGGKVSSVIISSSTDGSLPEVGIYSMIKGKANTVDEKSGLKAQEMTAADVIGEIKKTYLESGNKISDEADYSYKFTDGSTVVGKQLKSESNSNSNEVKEWLIVIVTEKAIYRFKFKDNTNQFDTGFKIATQMLSSWKITK